MGFKGLSQFSVWLSGSVSFLQLLGKISVTKDNEYPIERREFIYNSLEYFYHILLEPPFQAEEPQSAVNPHPEALTEDTDDDVQNSTTPRANQAFIK